MSKESFNFTARNLMLDIQSQIEEQDTEWLVETDCNNDVLKIEIDEKVFVINKQESAREIWLSSPISGPYHFKFQNQVWIDKHHNNLKHILQREVSSLMNKTITLL